MTRWEPLQVRRFDRALAGIMVARLAGTLDSTPEGYAFLEQVQQASHQGPVRLVIDLGEVGHVGSAGIGILAACWTSVVNRGGRMCLCGVAGRARMLLGVVHLLDVIDHEDTEDRAVARVSR